MSGLTHKLLTTIDNTSRTHKVLNLRSVHILCWYLMFAPVHSSDEKATQDLNTNQTKKRKALRKSWSSGDVDYCPLFMPKRQKQQEQLTEAQYKKQKIELEKQKLQMEMQELQAKLEMDQKEMQLKQWY